MKKQQNKSPYIFNGSSFSAIELPSIKEVTNKEWVYFGDKNLFPNKLIELYNESAMHHAAVDAIKDGIIGEGLEVLGESYINSQGDTVDDILEKIALDYTLFQSYSLNVIWSKEGNKIVEIYHLPFSNVRSGKADEDDNINEYYYSNDWKNIKKNPPIAYKSFDVTDNKGDNASQIYYFSIYTPGQQYYSLPSYIGAINDIELDARISKFHNSNISSGLAPSMFIQFRNGEPTPSERERIYNEIEETFAGENNAGRFFLAFSTPGNEMTIDPIQNANDTYYITLEERVSSRILSAHRVTSPMLLGIRDASGFSNNADEIETAYEHFVSTVIEPKRRKIMNSFGYILRMAGYNIAMTIKPKKLVIKDTTTNN